jgi:AmmeMemoRadiSam system protein A
VAEGDLTREERTELLRVARQSLETHFAERGPFEPEPATATLAEHRGAFVTLHRARDGELRGCVGMMRSEESLAATVARMAVSAAVEDGRFAPVTEQELPELQIEISALGPLLPIRPEDVEVGRHGLLISHQGRRGVLLPQVPVEHGWDRETFLGHTCMKAGLLPGTWQEEGVELLGFTAEVFGEER